jgi:hypothetical protein
VQGGFFLRKKPLGILLSLYSNWRNALAARVVSPKPLEKQPRILRLTIPNLKSDWGRVRSDDNFYLEEGRGRDRETLPEMNSRKNRKIQVDSCEETTGPMEGAESL